MPADTHHQAPADKTAKPADQDKPAKAPAVGDLVAHHYTHWNGAPHAQTGIVVAVDTDAGAASVNWLPDAVASVAFDDLEPIG